LVADLDMVRRVRALLEEHCGALSLAAGPVAAPAPPPVVVEQKPRKTDEQRVAEALETLSGDSFRSQDLRQALRKQSMSPSDGDMRRYLNGLLRKGSIAVAQAGVGRNGSTYRKLIPASSTPLPPDSADSPPTSAISPPPPTV
jgi:hypothetical protein